MAFREWIKGVFDVIRNYGIAAAVVLAAGALGKIADRSGSELELYAAYALMVLGYVLFLLNNIFSLLVLEEFEFFKRWHEHKVWSFVAFALATLFGLLLVGATVSYQQSSKGL